MVKQTNTKYSPENFSFFTEEILRTIVRDLRDADVISEMELLK